MFENNIFCYIVYLFDKLKNLSRFSLLFWWLVIEYTCKSVVETDINKLIIFPLII